jgi:L-fuconolactonase
MSAANEPREPGGAGASASERVGGAGGAKPPGQMIDAHQHFWKYNAAEYAWIDESMAALRRDFLPPDVQGDMDAANVRASIAVQARQTSQETDWLLDLADAHPFIAGVVGWVDLQASGVEAELERLSARPRLVGVRHVVQGEPDGFLEHPAFLRGIACLARWGLTYDLLVHARQLPAAVRFARAFPRQPFVLDHLGKPDIRNGGYEAWRRHFDLLATLPNVCCKLSGLVTEADWHAWRPGQLRPYLDAALEAFGPGRVMIGSDWPVCTVAGSYEDVIDVVLDAIDEYSAAEREMILGGTARQFWNLSVEHGRGPHGPRGDKDL